MKKTEFFTRLIKKSIAVTTALTVGCTVSGVEVLPKTLVSLVEGFVLNAGAEDLTFGEFTYVENSDKKTVTITKHNNSNAETVTIPSLINNKPVSGLGNWLFSDFKSLKTVNLPDSIKTIGEGVFNGCGRLENIDIPKNVNSIANRAFANCTSLSSITIPGSVENIYDGYNSNTGAFYNCKSLTSVIIEDGVKYIGNYSFNNCISLKSITIPGSVLEIGDGVFQGCSSLEAFTLEKGDNSQKIGNWAFSELTSLKEVNLPDTLESLSEGVFNGCSRIETIVIPKKVKSIANRAFANCTSLSSITIPGSVENIYGGYSNTGAFYNCTSLTSVIIEDGVKNIDGYSFNNCRNLKSITIPGSVLEIGNSAFQGCSSLEAFTLEKGNGTQRIGNGAFSGLTSLREVNLPDTLESLNEEVFNGCSRIETIAIPKKVKSIANKAFANCTSLSSIIIPGSVENIYAGYTNTGAFYNCESLTSVIIEDGVKYIGGYSFNNCSNLKSITIPGSVLEVGDGAFQGCSSLETFTLEKGGNSQRIGSWAFSGLTNLKEVNLPDTLESLSEGVFNGCSKLETIAIPKKVKSIANEAFANCTSLSSIIIPGSVENIYGNFHNNPGTFHNCTSLTSVIIEDGVKNIDSNVFRKCTNLKSVAIYGDKLLSIGENAFAECTSEDSKILIYGVPGLVAQDYASNYDYLEFSNIANYVPGNIDNPIDEKYQVNIPAFTGGKVFTSSNEYKKDDKVILLVQPNDNYMLKSLTVVGTGTSNILQISGSDNEYSFTMPSFDVTVSAAFEQMQVDDPDVPDVPDIPDIPDINTPSSQTLPYPRDTSDKAPSDDNKYYISPKGGGVNLCSLGSPVKRPTEYSSLPNCVGYAWGRAYEIYGVLPTLSKGNANDWYTYEADGYKRGQTPKLGAILCTTNHVAVVEAIHSDGTFTISESWWGDTAESALIFRAKKGTLKEIVGGKTFYGFIYLGDPPKEQAAMKDSLVKIGCPVDVEVFDNGNLIAKVENNEIVLGEDKICVIDDVKYLIVPYGKDYDIKIAAFDSGIMEYSVTSFNEDGTENIKEFNNIQLEKDKTFHSSIKSGDDEVELYVMDTDENVIAKVLVNGEETIVIIFFTGDVNGDSKVDGKDVTYLKRHLAGWNGYPLKNKDTTDMNNDNNVSEKDVTCLKRALAGWEEFKNLINKPVTV